MKRAKAYFIADLYMAEYYYSLLKRKYRNICIHIFNNFEEYFSKNMPTYFGGPYVSVMIRFYEHERFLDKEKYLFSVFCYHKYVLRKRT